MGLGSTAKKLQTVAEQGQKVYERLNKLRDEVEETRETVTETKTRVDELERESAEQRAILEALADDAGLDPDAIVARAHIEEPEAQGQAQADSGETATAGDDAGTASTGQDGAN